MTTASESGSSCEETGRRASNVSPWINSQGKIPREKANDGDQTQVKGAVIPPQFLLIVLVVEAVTAVLLWILPLPRISGAFKRGRPIVNRLECVCVCVGGGGGAGGEVKIETLFVNRGVALPHGSLHGAFKRVHPIVSKLVGGGGV